MTYIMPVCISVCITQKRDLSTELSGEGTKQGVETPQNLPFPRSPVSGPSDDDDYSNLGQGKLCECRGSGRGNFLGSGVAGTGFKALSRLQL